MTVNFKWGTASLFNLKGINPDLRKVADLALKLCPVDFRIADGLRTIAEQRLNVKKGVSKTMRSRHLTGHAIDFVPLVNGVPDFHTIARFKPIVAAFRAAAKQLGISTTMGADFSGYNKGWDWGHVELSWVAYPAKSPTR